jgi:tRNA(fMet)-specific endonuclease VapC
LVDSDWLVNVVIGLPGPLTTLRRLRRQELAISIISVGEVFHGAFGTADPEAELVRLRRFLRVYRTLPLTVPIMALFARLRADLRGRGMIIPDLDLLIAATALEHDLTLLTRNRRHFERIPGLKLYDEG